MEAPRIEVVQPGPRDAAAIAEMLNAHASALHGEPAIAAEEVVHWLRYPHVEFWIAAAPSGEIAAYADLFEQAERTRYWLDLREHPGRRELGGARSLLTRAEEWARAHGAPGALLRGSADAQDHALQKLYDEVGFHLIRHSFDMNLDLAGDRPKAVWPDGIAVRTFVRGEDDERVYEADMEAFQDHWEFVSEPFDEYRVAYLDHPGFDPSLGFVAEERGEIAGYCLCRVHASGDPAHGYVSSLAVRRPWRRRGLGLALLHYAFGEFRRRGMTQASLDVDGENLTGAVRLYERAGMSVAKRRDIFEKALFDS